MGLVDIAYLRLRKNGGAWHAIRQQTMIRKTTLPGISDNSRQRLTRV